jgi:hypothetical protein
MLLEVCCSCLSLNPLHQCPEGRHHKTNKIFAESHVPIHAELRQMRQKADSEKKEAALAEKTMSSIEAAAKKQYEKDIAEAQAVAKSHGDWVRRTLAFFWNCRNKQPHDWE